MADMELIVSRHVVSERGYRTLLVLLERLRKRARRLRVPEPEIIEVGHEDRPVMRKIGPDADDVIPTGEVRRYFTIEIRGEAPRLNGWMFVATIQHLPHEDGTYSNVLRTVPGWEGKIPEEYRSASRYCEHCKTTRNRIDTYLLQHESGRFIQLGKTCLKDFLGHKDPHGAAELAAMYADLDEAAQAERDVGEGWDGEHTPTLVLLQTYLEFVLEAIHQDGWLSGTKARELGRTSTAAVALNLMFPAPGAQRDDFVEPREAAKKEAAEIMEWIPTMFSDKTALSEYERNLKAIVSREVIEVRDCGFAASVVGVFRREMQREMERKARKPSTHFGIVGKRYELTLTVYFIHSFEGTYGPVNIFRVVDADGNVFVWFSSGSADLQRGETVKLKGTIKGHETYEGRPETHLTRCTVLEQGDRKEEQES
jgi:hypothetical protein